MLVNEILLPQLETWAPEFGSRALGFWSQRHFVLLLVLLGLNLNRLIVLIEKRYYEPTYRGCITVMGWIAEDVTQLERQIVCNITMVRIIADAERALAAEATAGDEKEPSAQLGQ